MSASVMHPAPIYGFGRMASVEELDSSLTRLSRHAVLSKGLPMTPPGTPVAQSPEQRFDYSPESPSAKIPPNTPVTPGLGPLRVATEMAASTCAAIPNVAGTGSPANIDNKIEQAMDLVKTHLTFAVREEIEVMKQTIADLEQRLVAAESENQLLRQYAPVEVVQNLAALVQQQRAQAAPETTTTTAPVLPPTLPAAFCSSALATTLNNVVADVRQQVRYGQPKDQ